MAASLAAQAPGSGSSTNETFTLSGTVVNSVTGEPIPHALVRTNGMTQRNAFTDSDGHFQMDGVPPGHLMLTAQKPGFVADHNAQADSPGWIQVGANTGAVTVRLAPQSAIWGRVTDAAGLPIEHVPVRLTARTVREGRRHWEGRGLSESDEDGHFRFADLNPGTYYVAAGPLKDESRLLPHGEQPASGFPHLYYPGVQDLASASPIQLGAGQQAEADFSLNAVPVYEVSGMVTGQGPDQGVGLEILTTSGDELSLSYNFNMESGTFRLDAVPAGAYLLRATSQAGSQPLRAEARINVNANADNLRLALGPEVTIPITARLEGHNNPGDPNRPPVSVRLLPVDSTNNELFSNYEHGPGRNGMGLQNVEAGTYTVELMPQVPWYVQSATWGQTNVLYDDIAVAASGQSYPMEIVLRDDSASLSGTVRTSDGIAARATVVAIRQPASKVAPVVRRGVMTTFDMSGLAPGDYLVFAFDSIEDMEYANPEVFQAYASQAAQVTLAANQKAQVTVDLIHVGKGD